MYCSLPIISLVFAKEEIMLPEEQEKKFQGAIPIKTVIINWKFVIPKWGKERFIAQLGDPGKSLKNIR